MTHIPLWWLALWACGPAQPVPSSPVPDTPEVEAPVAVDAMPDTSLYQIDAPLVDATGAALGFDHHAGHPVLVGMFYATCEHTCPMLIEEMKAVHAALPEVQREDTRLLLVSFAQDAPPVLTNVMERHDLDPTYWTLARTKPERVRELAMLLDVTYRRNPDAGFNHTSGFSVLDRDGVMRAQIPDMTSPKDPLHRAIAAQF